MLTTSNAKAYAVLAILVDMFGQRTIFVEPHLNGRENGFHVSGTTNSMKVSFAQSRGSDDIVVYFGQSTDFNSQGLGPANDEVYHKQSKYFRYDEYLNVAQFIFEKLTNEE